MSDSLSSPDKREVSTPEKGSERFNRFVEYIKENPAAKLAKQTDFKARWQELTTDPRNYDRAMRVLGVGLLTASVLGIFGDTPTFLSLNPGRMAGVDQNMMSMNYAALYGESARSMGLQKASIGIDLVSSILNIPFGDYVSKGLEVLPDTFVPKVKETLIARRDMLLRSMANYNNDKNNVQAAMEVFA